MFRKNTGNPHNRGAAHSGHPHRGGQLPQAKPKQVSSNYRVNLLHHNVSTQGQQPNYPSDHAGTRQPAFGRPQQQPRPQQQRPFPPRPEAKRGPQPRKGHGMLNVSIKEELLTAFIEKVRGEGKQVGEVVSQLVAAYTEEKPTP